MFLCALLCGGLLPVDTAEAQRGQGRKAKRAAKKGATSAKQRAKSLRQKAKRKSLRGRKSRAKARKRSNRERNRARARSMRRKKARARSPKEKATALRRRADRIAKTVRKAKSNKHARRYLRSKAYKRDVRKLLSGMGELQQGGKLDAATEHRLMGAAGRVLYAAFEVDPNLVPDQQVDKFDKLYSRAAYKRKSPHHETSVEIETQMTEQILDAITTKDGTVRPILEEGGKQPPQFLKKMAKNGDVKKVKWDKLSRNQKISLLRSQSKGRQFFSDRRIPGVVFRNKIGKPTSRAVTLGGKKAERNAKKVSVKDVIMRKVEYMGPTAVDKVSGVEFHVRQRGKASRNAKDAFTVVDLFNSPTTQGHQHVPNHTPSGVLRDNAVERASLVDFYRRVNMVAELRSIKDGYLIKPVKDGSVTFFDFLKGKGLQRMNDHFHSLAKRGEGVLRDSELKMGAVGFRRGELYGNKKMFGFEVRTLDKKSKERGKFVDSVQKGVLTGRYGLRRSVMRRWHAKHVGNKGKKGSRDYVKRQGSVLKDLHYNRPVNELLSQAPKDLQPHLNDKVKQRLQKHAETHYGLKMLVHNFSRDPALHGTGKGKIRAQVRKAQKQGLRSLESGAKPTQVVKKFAETSGLYEAYTRSIGMRDPSVGQQ